MYKAKILMLLLVFNLSISLPGGAFTGICNGYEKFVYPRVVNIIRYIVRSLLVFFILFHGGKAISLVVIDTVLNITIIVVDAYYVIKILKVKIKLIELDKKLIKTIFSYSIWIFVFAMIGELFWKSGQMILGITISTDAVAIYAVGIVLSGYFGAFAGAINSVFLPKATFMVEQLSTRAELTEMMIKIGRIVSVILIFIWGAFLLFGKQFILLWVGETYTDSYLITLIIMTAYILPLVQNFANSIIEATGRFKFKAIVYFFTISTGIFLGAYFSQFYGYWAIAWCYSIFWFISQLIMNWYFDKKLNINIKVFFIQTFGKLLIALILSLIVGYFLNIIIGEGWGNFILKSVLYSIIYSLLAYYIVLNDFEKKQLLPSKFFK